MVGERPLMVRSSRTGTQASGRCGLVAPPAVCSLLPAGPCRPALTSGRPVSAQCTEAGSQGSQPQGSRDLI